MKKVFISSLFILCCTVIFAQVKMPAPSPTQTIKQAFAMGTIELTYSRPGAKGRKVFGELVPYNKLWRTGANGATIIKFTDPVEIKGKKIDTGSYALYTIPGPDYWDVILNKGTGNWGIENYKEADDVFRIRVESTRMKDKLETFTMQFAEIKPESCELDIMWEKTAIAIPIISNIKDRLRAQIAAAMLTDKKPYWQAAQFYNEYDNNPAKALENVTQAITENEKAYYMWLYKAKIQKSMGDKTGAMESSKRSLELAKQEKNDDYIKMNEDLQRKLK